MVGLVSNSKIQRNCYCGLEAEWKRYRPPPPSKRKGDPLQPRGQIEEGRNRKDPAACKIKSSLLFQINPFPS